MKKVKVLLYCTKAKPFLIPIKNDNQILYETFQFGNLDYWRISHKKVLNGKIVAECEVETEEIRLSAYSDYEDKIYLFDTPTLTNDELTQKSCLCNDELDDYLINEKGYALNISNLFIFKNPVALSDYNVDNSSDYGSFDWAFEENERITPLKKAPQNMMKVFDKQENPYVLISIRPKWLCKILNGEKTIEVRKRVLKEML